MGLNLIEGYIAVVSLLLTLSIFWTCSSDSEPRKYGNRRRFLKHGYRKNRQLRAPNIDRPYLACFCPERAVSIPPYLFNTNTYSYTERRRLPRYIASPGL